MVETTEGAGENNPKTPAPLGYFRLYAELRLVIKNRPADESNEKKPRNGGVQEI